MIQIFSIKFTSCGIEDEQIVMVMTIRRRAMDVEQG